MRPPTIPDIDPPRTEVTIQLDEQQYRKLTKLARLMQAPNLPSAMWAAIKLAHELYSLQDDNWQLRIERGDDVRRFQLPRFPLR